MAYLGEFPAVFVGFLQTLVSLPAGLYALAVALFFGITTVSKPGVVLVPAIAALVYTALLVVAPVVLGQGGLVLPAFDAAFGLRLVAAYIVFFIADSAIYGAKRVVLKLFD